jgi:hypothetical protein
MKRVFTFIIIFNLLLSMIGVAQFVHYCCDTKSAGYFSAPSCCCNEGACEEEKTEDSGCCKDEVKIVQLQQDGISTEKSKINKPILIQSFFSTRADHTLRITKTPSLFSIVNRNYSSPPLYIVNRLLLI